MENSFSISDVDASVSLLGLWPTFELYFLQYATWLQKRRHGSWAWQTEMLQCPRERWSTDNLNQPVLTHQITQVIKCQDRKNHATEQLRTVRHSRGRSWHVFELFHRSVWCPSLSSPLPHTCRPNYSFPLISYMQSLWVSMTKFTSSTYSEDMHLCYNPTKI